MNAPHKPEVQPKVRMGRINALIAGLVLIASLAIALAIWPRGKPLPADGLRIAAILNLSGPASRFDAVKQKTLEIAEARVRELHPGTSISIRVFDAGGGPEATASAVRQAREWGAQCYLTGTSPTALAVSAALRNVTPQPIHMANAATPEFGPPKPREYRLWPDWEQEAGTIEGICAEGGFKQVVLLHSADPYSQALKSALAKKLMAAGQRIVLEQQFDPASSPDFRPLLIKAKSQNLSALIVLGLPPGINALANQLAEIGWKTPVVGGVNITLTLQTFAQLKLTCPLWVVETDAMSADLPGGSEAFQFRQTYKAKFNEEPPFHALYLADAIYLLTQSSLEAANVGKSISEQLATGVAFECASGSLHLQTSGVLNVPMKARRVQ